MNINISLTIHLDPAQLGLILHALAAAANTDDPAKLAALTAAIKKSTESMRVELAGA
jgi:hypothetical protein